MWELHTSLAFAAVLDPQVHRALGALEHELGRDLARISQETFRGVASPFVVRQLLSTTTATMRALAMLTFVGADADAEWRTARRHLTTLWIDAINSAES